MIGTHRANPLFLGNESPFRKDKLRRNSWRARDARIVARDDERAPFLGKAFEGRRDGSGVRVVEMGAGLVEKEEGRVSQERSGERHALTLAPGERASRDVGKIVHRKSLQESVGSTHVLNAQAIWHAREENIFADGHRVDELVVLEHEADLVPPHLGTLGIAKPRGWFAVDEHLPARRGEHRAEESEESRLAATTRPTQ